MSRWVTFYEDVVNGISDIKVHKNKVEATKYFKNNYKNYFQLATDIKVYLPMSFGYCHRRFCGISKYAFEKAFEIKLEEVEK